MGNRWLCEKHKAQWEYTICALEGIDRCAVCGVPCTDGMSGTVVDERTAQEKIKQWREEAQAGSE